MNYIAYAFGFIAAIITFISTQIKEKKQLLYTYTLSYLFFSVNFILIGAITGGITCLVIAVQTISISNNKNIKPKVILFSILTILIGIITYENLISIFPTLCNLIFIFTITNNKMKNIRKLTIISRLL